MHEQHAGTRAVRDGPFFGRFALNGTVRLWDEISDSIAWDWKQSGRPGPSELAKQVPRSPKFSLPRDTLTPLTTTR